MTLLLPVDNAGAARLPQSGPQTAQDFIFQQLPFYDEQYTRIDPIRVSTCTFNVATKKPPNDISFMKTILKDDPDIVVIGLQEVDMSATALIREETEAALPWIQTILECVGCDTVEYESQSHHFVVPRSSQQQQHQQHEQNPQQHEQHKQEYFHTATNVPSAAVRQTFRDVNSASSIVKKQQQEKDEKLELEKQKSKDKKKPFFLLAVRQLVGLMVIACARRSTLLDRVREVSVSTVSTGALAGSVANKGAIGIRVVCERSSYCFINCHLAAHQKEVAKRNEDISEVLSRMNLAFSNYDASNYQPVFVDLTSSYNENVGSSGSNVSSSSSSSSSVPNKNVSHSISTNNMIPVNYIYRRQSSGSGSGSNVNNNSSDSVILPKEHDQVVILGDLNYRVDLTYEVAVSHCHRNDIKSLLKEDQLGKELRHPHSPWFGFTDLTPTFLPTYRYDLGTDNFDTSEKKRIPSFTDRILFWSKADAMSHRGHHQASLKQQRQLVRRSSFSVNNNNENTTSTSNSNENSNIASPASEGASNTESPSSASPSTSTFEANDNSSGSKGRSSSSKNSSIEVISFDSISKATCSDHKPVFATLALPMKCIEPKLYEETITSLRTLVQQVGLKLLAQPSISISSSSSTSVVTNIDNENNSNNNTIIDFGECSCLDPTPPNRSIFITNTGRCVAECALLRRNRDDPSDATWIRVPTSHFSILPGATFQLDVNGVMDWSSLRWSVTELPFQGRSTIALKSEMLVLVRGSGSIQSQQLSDANKSNSNVITCTCSCRLTCLATTIDVLLRCGNVPVSVAYALPSRPSPGVLNLAAASTSTSTSSTSATTTQSASSSNIGMKPQIPKELWYLADAISKFPTVPGLFTEFATEKDARLLLRKLSGLSSSSSSPSSNNNSNSPLPNIVACPAEQCPEGSTSVFSAAIAFMILLRDLQVSVIPASFLQAAALASRNGPQAVMKFTTEQLPTIHFNVFLYVISLLRFLLRPQHTCSNELTPQLLAQVFSGVLFSLSGGSNSSSSTSSRATLGSKPFWMSPSYSNYSSSSSSAATTTSSSVVATTSSSTSGGNNANNIMTHGTVSSSHASHTSSSSSAAAVGTSSSSSHSTTLTHSNSVVDVQTSSALRAQADDEISSAVNFLLSFLQ